MFLSSLQSSYQALKSIESKIALRKLPFLGRLPSADKMAPVVRKLFEIRANSYFDTNIDSLGVS